MVCWQQCAPKTDLNASNAGLPSPDRGSMTQNVEKRLLGAALRSRATVPVVVNCCGTNAQYCTSVNNGPYSIIGCSTFLWVER